jgi:hypothetical protein
LDAQYELSLSDQSRWEVISDQVLGVGSDWSASFEVVDGQPALRLAGDASEADCGGFILARTKLKSPLHETAQGVVLKARGNGQPVFLQLQVKGNRSTWKHYRASFRASYFLEELRIPFRDFAALGRHPNNRLDPTAILRLTVAAVSLDHCADLTVVEIGFY